MEGLRFGMSETNDNKSKRVAFDNVIDVDDECGICFETLADERTPVKLRCGHPYHLHCIGSWFNVKNIMLCPTCKQVEQGEWLFARSSPPPSPDFNVPLVQPFIGGLPDEGILDLGFESPPIRRRLSLTLEDHPARSTSSMTFDLARREMMLQEQIAADFPRTLAVSEHRMNRELYGFDIGSSSGEGGSYNRGRRNSIGGESDAQRMATAQMMETRATDLSQALPLPLPPRAGPVATTNGGETSGSGSGP